MFYNVECISKDDEILETGEIEAISLKQCLEALLAVWDDKVPHNTVKINIMPLYDEEVEDNASGMTDQPNDPDDAQLETCADDGTTLGMYAD